MLKLLCVPVLILLLYVFPLKAQDYRSAHEQLKFADYLVRNNLYDDFFTLLNTHLNNSSFAPHQRDSLYLLAGHAYFNIDNYDSAVCYFNKVDRNSHLFGEACFYAAYNLSATGHYDKSFKLVSGYTPTNMPETSLRELQLAGITLLMRDTAQYHKYKNSGLSSDSSHLSEKKQLALIASDINEMPRRSGALAGLMSTMIPGLGKIYAGKMLQGATSFVPVTLLGLQAFEAYKKAGAVSARFIASVALFSVFYIGDIWGSILSVSVVRNEINNEINNQILFNLRIPVQKLFR